MDIDNNNGRMKEVILKKILLGATMLMAAMMISGCIEKEVYVHTPVRPATPTGLTSITGDEFIELLWYAVDMDDIDHYNIYWAPGDANPSNPDNYELMVSVPSSLTDFDVTNGVTYYYSVTAVNEDDLESYMSNYAFDTPRPAGYDVTLYDYHQAATRDSSGYDLLNQEKLAYNNPDCDIYLEYNSTNNLFYVDVRQENYYIQDIGYASDFDDVGYAPPDGWSAQWGLEAIENHIYMLKLRHGEEWHYAKIWITNLSETHLSMEFSWAYQIDPGNRELVIRPEKLKAESGQNQSN
jgi:hypothetical protein